MGTGADDPSLSAAAVQEKRDFAGQDINVVREMKVVAAHTAISGLLWCPHHVTATGGKCRAQRMAQDAAKDWSGRSLGGFAAQEADEYTHQDQSGLVSDS